jgi:multiple sugar transport system substrate-binding protein
VSACDLVSSLPGANKPAVSGKVQLVYQDWRTEWFPPMAQHMLEEFHATHPNIRVFYTLDPENLEQKMPVDFQAGVAPDVFQGCCAFFPIWAQKNYLLDLRALVQADIDRDTIADWDPVQYKALFTASGKQYGLPKYHGALALYYNKDVFDQQRVVYPDDSWNHDDYLAAMKRLVRRDAAGKTDVWGSMLDISWERIQVHVNAWGGHFVDPQDPTKSMLANDATLRAVQWLRDRMWQDKVMATPLDVNRIGTRQAFVSGRLAMVEDGSWALKDVLAGAGFRVGLCPFPKGPARRATLATTDGFGIFAGTKHREAAWELLKFLISKEYGRAMARYHFLQPARASLVPDWVEYIRAEYPEKARDLDIAAFADGHIKGYSVVAEAFANMDVAKDLTDAAWNQILTLGQLPVEHLKTVSQQIEQAQSAR